MAGEFVSIERLTEIHLGDVETIEAIEAIGREGFDDGEFSIRSEITRTWARLWVARLATPTPDAPIGAPVGFLVRWHVADELHVLNVATASAMRRRGIARALMDESLRYAAEHHLRIILLEVRRSNRAAILSVILFFVAGGLLLIRVDIQAARRAAGTGS